MCDFDGDYVWIRVIDVVTRKPHQCNNCQKIFPPKSKMTMGTGVYENKLINDYTCETCNLLSDEHYEGSPLHICQGGLQEGEYDYGWQRYRYVRQCIEEDEPIIMAVLKLIQDGFLEQGVLV